MPHIIFQSFSRPNPCIGCNNYDHRVTRDFFPFIFYTRYIGRVSIQHKVVIRLRQFHYCKVLTRLSQGCLRPLWRPCDNFVISIIMGVTVS